ncbi:prolyl oligopeptidase family serine peptidase [Aquimarina sediminis]|uniref:prolyl oligopeptidase family serine peptidase n=1 Tax=Aquimarina sediminis TaxID=2070536 RepID=UPI000CA045F1|nr:prolyl oligopeptidase family serine peptidase [Aquimarina sediminis]
MHSKLILLLIFFQCSLLITAQSKVNFLLPQKIAIDEYHGQKIEDPYRYAEDLNISKVKEWITKQNCISNRFLDKINKKQYLIDQQAEYDRKKSFVISKLKVTENDNHFYLKRLPNENTPKLYYRATFSSQEELLYDPINYDSNSNIEYVINYIQPSWDGTKIVVSLTKKGREISEMIILDVISKKVHPEVIKSVWPSNTGGIEWLPDNSGFIYVHYTTTDVTSKQFLLNTKSVVYKLGENPNEIEEVFSKQHNPKLNLKEADMPITSFQHQNSKYLIGITPAAGNYYNSYYIPIHQIKSNNWKPLFKKSDQIKGFISKGDSIVFLTSKNASNFKICITSIKNPDFENPKVLVREKRDEVITDLDLTKDGLYFVTTKNGVNAKLFKLENKKQKEIKFSQVYGDLRVNSKGLNSSELWITAKGWTTDNKRYEYNNEKLIEKNLNEIIDNNRFNEIIIEEVEVEAHDGKKIPLSIFYKKGTKKNSKNSLLLYGYGAYGISVKPSFYIDRLLWILEGGVYAIAHVRGGGEKGEAWHKGGYKSTKPNTWKDFISCAEYLISNKYTSKEKLATWSGSAGGILIGRAITERPDLFAAAIVEFGSLNMLRSEMRPNGIANIKEFGALKNPVEFKGLLEMDAYHHIQNNVKYPATLITAGLNDARVPAWFSVKFAARLQRANISNNENLLLIDKNTGHGIDDTKLKSFNRFATILSFALWQTGHPDYQPSQP